MTHIFEKPNAIVGIKIDLNSKREIHFRFHFDLKLKLSVQIMDIMCSLFNGFEPEHYWFEYADEYFYPDQRENNTKEMLPTIVA